MRFVIPSLLSLALMSPCGALAIRGYSASVHDRFTGFPGTPVMNPGFLYDASRFTGVGWCNQASHQQFTLVTPRHFICANHSGAKPAIGNTVRYVGKDGSVNDRTVTALSNISNDSGGNSDLVVGTLDSPLPSSVVPLPWLNLGNNNSETSYQGISLIVLGFFARGGAGTLTGFQSITETGEIENTRCSIFSYTKATGGANDCYFEGGDSGSPTFSLANSEPAIVGTHSSAATTPVANLNYDCFYPHYATKVDTLLATEGYRVRPVNATATTVAAASAAGGTLQQGSAGSVTFTVSNTGSAVAGNVELLLQFAPAEAPDAIAMTGWVAESRGSGLWSLRKATLAAGASGTATATWASLPKVASLAVTTTLDSDATTPLTAQAAFTLTAPSPYAEWSKNLSDPAQTADPDGDGVTNLLEYALGGDPAASSLTAPAGQLLLPQLGSTADGHLDFIFAKRSDAATRGLTYVVETSQTLEAGSWVAALPDQAEESETAFDPAVDGFVLHHVSFTPTADHLFLRLRVELNETP